MSEEVDGMVEVALRARERAYAPYSGFRVGAAVVSVDGDVFAGCNVENLSYGLTICAERNAIGAAVASGVLEIKGVVIVAESVEPVSPCGACRQVLAEFGEPWIVCVNLEGARFETNVRDLLPRAKTGILDRPGDG